jgi:hypothetical protein
MAKLSDLLTPDIQAKYPFTQGMSPDVMGADLTPEQWGATLSHFEDIQARKDEYAEEAKRNVFAKPNEDQGVLKGGAEALWQGVKQGTWGTTKKLAANVVQAFGSPETFANAQHDIGQSDKDVANAMPKSDNPLLNEFYHQMEGLGSASSGIAMGAVNPWMGAATFGLQGGSEAAYDIQSRGGSGKQALAGGIGMGALNVALMRMPIGRLLGEESEAFLPTVKKNLIQFPLINMSLSAAQNALMAGTVDPNMTFGQYAEDVLKSGARGIPAGILFAAPSALSTKVTDKMGSMMERERAKATEEALKPEVAKPETKEPAADRPSVATEPAVDEVASPEPVVAPTSELQGPPEPPPVIQGPPTEAALAGPPEPPPVIQGPPTEAASMGPMPEEVKTQRQKNSEAIAAKRASLTVPKTGPTKEMKATAASMRKVNEEFKALTPEQRVAYKKELSTIEGRAPTVEEASAAIAKARLAEPAPMNMGERAKARMEARAKERGGKMFSGIDPGAIADLGDLAIRGAQWVKDGVVKTYEEFKAKLQEQFPKAVPHAKMLWKHAQSGVTDTIKAKGDIFNDLVEKANLEDAPRRLEQEKANQAAAVDFSKSERGTEVPSFSRGKLPPHTDMLKSVLTKDDLVEINERAKAAWRSKDGVFSSPQDMLKFVKQIRDVWSGKEEKLSKEERGQLKQLSGIEIRSGESKSLNVMQKVGTVMDVARSMKILLNPFHIIMRQGIIPSMAHPLQAGKNIKAMLDVARKPGAFEAAVTELQMKESSRVGTELDTPLRWSIPGQSGGANEFTRGSNVITRISEKVPGLKWLGKVASWNEKVFCFGKNVIMSEWYENGYKQLKEKWGDSYNPNKITPEQYKALSELAVQANHMVGSGDYGRFKDQHELMGTLVFAPRLMFSRFNLVGDLAKMPAGWVEKLATGENKYIHQLDPAVQKIVLKEVGRAAVTLFGAVTAYAAATGSTVTWDPTDQNFGKVVDKHGTKLDIMGGWGPLIRTATQAAYSQFGGKVGEHNFTPREIVQNYARSQLAPVPSLAYTVAERKATVVQAADLFSPMIVDGVVKGMLSSDDIEKAMMPAELVGGTVQEPQENSRARRRGRVYNTGRR